jgi:hypothetical protein
MSKSSFSRPGLINIAGSKKCAGQKKRRAWVGLVGGQHRYFLIFCFFFIKKKDKEIKVDKQWAT